MANLMLTTACNLRCKYCFGREIIGPGLPSTRMSRETFDALLAWIVRAGEEDLDIHLMGGEPTLHPEFGYFVDRILKAGRQIMVFSNAAVELEDGMLESCASRGVQFVVNVNDPEVYAEGQLDILRANLAKLGEVAAVTLNVCGADTPYEYALSYIREFGLAPELKIGVALPTLTRANEFVGSESFGEVRVHLAEIIREARAQKLKVEFECGVPYCVLDSQTRSSLEGVMISHCGSRLDITPAGEVFNCLPLISIAKIPYRRFAHYGEAAEWFRDAFAPYRSLGHGPECMTCEHRTDGVCSQCLAYVLPDVNDIVMPPEPNACADAPGGG